MGKHESWTNKNKNNTQYKTLLQYTLSNFQPSTIAPWLTFHWDFTGTLGNGEVRLINFSLTVKPDIPAGFTDFSFDVTPNLLFLSSLDVNGDGKIDITDIFLVAKAFGSTPGSFNWDPRCDVNGDDKVDITDLFLVAKYYGSEQF